MPFYFGKRNIIVKIFDVSSSLKWAFFLILCECEFFFPKNDCGGFSLSDSVYIYCERMLGSWDGGREGVCTVKKLQK